MATTFNRWVGNHWSKGSGTYSADSLPTELASGLLVFRLDDNASTLRLYGTMHPNYTGGDISWGIVWTVASGVTGSLNLAMVTRRYIDGTNPASPESAQFGPGLVAAPTALLPKLTTITITQADTAPLSGGAGIQAEEDYYLKITRAGTLTGDAYILGIEGYF